MKFAFSAELLQIIHSIQFHGGKPLLVGGAVRDWLLGIPSKDTDIEVYGLNAQLLINKILSRFGDVDQVGMSFGIIKLRSKSNTEYDFSIPRRENKAGSGHRGFIVEPDPSMTPQEACSRRDFTINAMAYDFSNDRILDFFNGQLDLNNKILRHTSAAFTEDPLRVLRGMQFAARFGLKAADETLELCRTIKSEYKTLAKERIWSEWQKWATKSKHPGKGLEFLAESGWIDLYPILSKLSQTQQNPVWHPEGNVFIHTCLVTDAASKNAIRDGLDEEKTCLSVIAGLCHDLGKPETTILEEGVWRSPGHPEAGVSPSQQFLEEIGAPLSLIEKCLPLVKEHLAYLQTTSSKTVRRLATRLGAATIEELIWLIEADHSGRAPLPAGLPEDARKMLEKAKETDTTQGRQLPILMGKHLLQEGLISPGPSMGKLLKAAYEAQMDGVFTDILGGMQFAKEYLKINASS